MSDMKILFVCEGNVNRSQMAETMLKGMVPGVEVMSAGTMVAPHREGEKVADESMRGIEAMREIGFDMSESVQNVLTPEMLEWADRLILMGPTPGGPLPEFLAHSPKLETWDVPDPGWAQCTVEEARDMTLERITELAATLGSSNKSK